MELFGGGGGGAGAGPEQEGVGGQLGQLFGSKLFVILTLSLCGLFFVVTGVQFWITDYATRSKQEGGLGADAETVVLVFSIASVTAPVMGVFIGGALIDKQGGYKDDPNSSDPVRAPLAHISACCSRDGAETLLCFGQPGLAAARTLRTCLNFALGAAAASFPAAFSNDFAVRVANWPRPPRRSSV